MKQYNGQRTIDGLVVTVNGEPLDPRFDLATYDEKGFEWSYEGTAPRQLALAILADHFPDPSQALDLVEDFMINVIAGLDNDWALTSSEIERALLKSSGAIN